MRIPKYRFRSLKNNIGKEVYRCIYVYCNQFRCEVVELSVQVTHVHLVITLPPKLSISKLMVDRKAKSELQSASCEEPVWRRVLSWLFMNEVCGGDSDGLGWCIEITLR